MKSTKIYLVTFLILVMAVSCNENEKVVGESSFINGKVSFINPFTHELTSSDSIMTVLLRSTVKNQFYNEIAERKGSGYIFGPLEVSNIAYKVEFNYKLNLSSDGTNFYAFQKDTLVSISANDQVRELGNVIMDSVPSTQLRVNVTDESGNPLPDINICLYRNPDLIDTLYNCNNAERLNITTQSGFTLLAPLNPVTYYIKAWGCYGEFGYDNLYDGAINSTGNPLEKNRLTEINIVLKRRSCEPTPSETTLEIKTVDENGFPLPLINVCLFLNPDFVDTTFSCDYSEHSLTTNEYGIVTFTNLDPVTYFFKAWGEFDYSDYDNFYDDAVKSTGGPLEGSTTKTIEVVLQKTVFEESFFNTRNNKAIPVQTSLKE